MASLSERKSRFRRIAGEVVTPPLWSELAFAGPGEGRPLGVGGTDWAIWSYRMAENSRDITDDREAPIFAAVRFTDQQLDESSDALILVQVVAALAGREAHEAIEATYWNGLEGTPIVNPHGDASQIQLVVEHMAAYLLGAAGTDNESPGDDRVKDDGV